MEANVLDERVPGERVLESTMMMMMRYGRAAWLMVLEVVSRTGRPAPSTLPLSLTCARTASSARVFIQYTLDDGC